jgi:hypothetical protein
LDETSESTSPKLTDTQWKLSAFVTGGNTKAPEHDADNRYRMVFKDDNTLEGKSSTNELRGNYEINTQTSSFRITNLGGTKINELDGTSFVEALREVHSFDCEGHPAAIDDRDFFRNLKKDIVIYVNPSDYPLD